VLDGSFRRPTKRTSLLSTAKDAYNLIMQYAGSSKRWYIAKMSASPDCRR